MPAQQIELGAKIAQRASQHEIRAATLVVGDRPGGEIHEGVVQAERYDALARSALGPDRIGLVVTVEHGGAGCVQAIENLALGLDDPVRATELADVGGARVGNYADIRAHQIDGVRNIAGPRSAELDDGAAMTGAQLQQRQWRTQVICGVINCRARKATRSLLWNIGMGTR